MSTGSRWQWMMHASGRTRPVSAAAPERCREGLLRVLDAALRRDYCAFAEVRLVELANPVESVSIHVRRALHEVLAKSVDFVTCDIFTLDPVAAGLIVLLQFQQAYW